MAPSRMPEDVRIVPPEFVEPQRFRRRSGGGSGRGRIVRDDRRRRRRGVLRDAADILARRQAARAIHAAIVRVRRRL